MSILNIFNRLKKEEEKKPTLVGPRIANLPKKETDWKQTTQELAKPIEEKKSVFVDFKPVEIPKIPTPQQIAEKTPKIEFKTAEEQPREQTAWEKKVSEKAAVIDKKVIEPVKVKLKEFGKNLWKNLQTGKIGEGRSGGWLKDGEILTTVRDMLDRNIVATRGSSGDIQNVIEFQPVGNKNNMTQADVDAIGGRVYENAETGDLFKIGKREETLEESIHRMQTEVYTNMSTAEYLGEMSQALTTSVFDTYLGMLKPQEPTNAQLRHPYMKLAGNVVGSLLAVQTSKMFVDMAALSVPDIASYKAAHPYIYNTLATGSAGVGRGQLTLAKEEEAQRQIGDKIYSYKKGSKEDIDFKDRIKQVAIDLPVWLAFGATGEISALKPQYYVPAYFSTGFMDAKLNGKNNIEALTQGITTCAFGSIMKFAEAGKELAIQQELNNILDKRAIDILNRYGANLDTEALRGGEKLSQAEMDKVAQEIINRIGVAGTQYQYDFSQTETGQATDALLGTLTAKQRVAGLSQEQAESIITAIAKLTGKLEVTAPNIYDDFKSAMRGEDMPSSVLNLVEPDIQYMYSGIPTPELEKLVQEGGEYIPEELGGAAKMAAEPGLEAIRNLEKQGIQVKDATEKVEIDGFGQVVKPEVKPEVSPELQPLYEEAKKYKSAEEFVKNYDGGLILNKDKFNEFISGGPNNEVMVSEVLGPVGKKFIQDIGLQVAVPKELQAENKLKTIYEKNADKVEQALGEVFMEFDVSEAGSRIFGYDMEDTTALKSTFPEWLDDNLRSRKLLDEVKDNLYDIKDIQYSPENKAKVNAIYSNILDEVDKRIGVDTSQLRADIIEQANANKEVSKILEKQIKKLIKEVEKINRPATIAETKGAVKKITGEPSPFVRKREMTLLKDRIKNFARGVKEGRRDVIAEIADVKKQLTQYVNTFLPSESRFKMIADIKNITKQEQLADALKKVDKIVGELEVKEVAREIKKDLSKVDLKKLRPERRDAIKKIMEDFTMQEMRPSTERKLQSRIDYIKENPDNQIPESKIKELERLQKTPLSKMTKEDLELIRDSIRHEIKLNELKNNMIFGNRYREAKIVTNEAITNINSKVNAIKQDANLIDSSIKPQEVSKLKQIFTLDSYNPELLSEILDRQKQGIIKKVLYGGIDKGTTEMLRVQQESNDWLKEKLQGINIENWSNSFQEKTKNVDYQKVELPSGKTIKLTKGERISFLLHSQNNKNLNHLLNGGFRFDTNKVIKYQITQDDLSAIINSATPEEKKVAKVFSEFLNDKIKTQLNKVSVKLNGWEIAKEENYYPIRTQAIDRERDASLSKRNFTQQSLEGMGILKERTNASNALIIDDSFKTIYEHLKKTSSYIGLAEPLRNARMMALDSNFNDAVNKNYGTKWYKYIDEYLKNIEGTALNTDNITKLGADLMNKMDVAFLGLNPFVIAKQPLSYWLASTEIDAKYLSKAVATKINTDEMAKWSPQLRDRLTGKVSREVGELADVGAVRHFFTGKTALSSKLMGGIQKADYEAVGRIWNAVKLEVKDKSPSLEGDDFMKRVAIRAEEVIRLTQPTYLTKDRSAVARSDQFWTRMFTKYTSQLNKNYNIIRRAILDYDTSSHSSSDKGNLLKTIAIVSIVSGIGNYLVNKVRNKLYKRKEKKTVTEIVDITGAIFSPLYFASPLFNSLSSKVENGTYGGFGLEDPVQSFLGNGIDMISETTTGVDQFISGEKYKSGDKKDEEKWITSAKKAADKAGSVIGQGVGIPYDTLSNIISSFDKWINPEETKKSKGLPGLPPLPKLPSLPSLPPLPKM